MLRRNLLGLTGTIVLYAIAFRSTGYAMEFLQVEGGGRFLALIVFHACFGVLAYFFFIGRTFLRAVWVFVAIFAYGVAMEIIMPDPRHQLVQVFVTVPFGVLAAGFTSLGSFFEKMYVRLRA
jgi:hypothetical protein